MQNIQLEPTWNLNQFKINNNTVYVTVEPPNKGSDSGMGINKQKILHTHLHRGKWYYKVVY